MKRSLEDTKILNEIYREVIDCHYYSKGQQYCADFLGINTKRVRRIAQDVRSTKIYELDKLGLSNEELAIALGCKLSRVAGFKMTVLGR